MDRKFYQALADKSLGKQELSPDECAMILANPDLALLPLLNAAYEVRKHFWGTEVLVHILNNVQNGLCPEDCHYCAQAKTSRADIAEYGMKSDEEIFREAQTAVEQGAFRYCLVFAGRGPLNQRVEHLADLVKKIKARFAMEVCVSAGILDEQAARQLKDAGLDRLNHNLNTSERFYPSICTTHTYADRLDTLRAARQAGLDICSGLIIGMGEEDQDIIEVALNLRRFQVKSIPLNFFIPIAGNQISCARTLTPEYCLRVLCLFRFLNPDAELRVAAGRELHLRDMEVLALYPANSLFLEGYLNAQGSSNAKTYQMIQDAGFTIKSEVGLDQLLAAAKEGGKSAGEENALRLKSHLELRPHLTDFAGAKSRIMK